MPPGKGQMTLLLPTPKASAPTLQGTHGPAAGGCAQPLEGPCLPQGRSKKKSRKHQRFMERRALLEQKGLLSPRRRLGSQAPTAGPEAGSTLTKVDGTMAPRCGKVTKPKQVVSPSLSPSASPDSIARHHSVLLSQGNGSSKGVRTSSPLLRPGKYVAIDCEMVGTGPQGRLSELARCSVVNYEGDVIYDKYVQPELPIVDYRTRWSGITKQHMKSAIPFKAAQAEVRKERNFKKKKKKRAVCYMPDADWDIWWLVLSCSEAETQAQHGEPLKVCSGLVFLLLLPSGNLKTTTEGTKFNTEWFILCLIGVSFDALPV